MKATITILKVGKTKAEVQVETENGCIFYSKIGATLANRIVKYTKEVEEKRQPLFK